MQCVLATANDERGKIPAGDARVFVYSLTKEAEETELAKQMALVSCKSYDMISSANSRDEHGIAFVSKLLGARRSGAPYPQRRVLYPAVISCLRDLSRQRKLNFSK